MPVNERKDTFKRLIMERMAGENGSVSRAELVDHVQTARPDLCDENEPCYPNCNKHHALWIHQFDRAIYDLRQTVPRKLRTVPGKRGHYTRG